MRLSDSIKEPVTGQGNTRTFSIELWLLNHDTTESPRWWPVRQALGAQPFWKPVLFYLSLKLVNLFHSY